MNYSGKRVVILGLARQGVALARYLAEAGAQVVVSDRQPAEARGVVEARAALQSGAALTIEYVLGGHPDSLLDGADLLCLSGGVDAHLPLVEAARARGIPLSNDTQIFLEACPTPRTVGITGSAGKTTTTTLVGRMLGAGAPPVWVGGNIGHPLIAEVGRIGLEDHVVLELSSFQLEIMTRSTRVAAILNVTPNHLDRHGTMQAYTAAKANLLRCQTADGVAVLGWDNAAARDLRALARGPVAYFSGQTEVAAGTFLRGEALIWRWAGREHEICRTDLIALRGRHNVLNVLAACAISGAALEAADAAQSVAQMRAGITGFTGVAHRLEPVAERRGAKWYNDSIASAPERVVAALQSFDEPIVLLLGGRDKKLPWEELAALVARRVRHTILFGEAGPLIERALRAAGVPEGQLTRCERLQDAVAAAARQAQPGDVVLLSPGCTSFDAFTDFAERGERFRQWVQEL